MLHDSDKHAFKDLIVNVMDFYKQDVSTFSLQVWWGAVSKFDMPALEKAFGIHCTKSKFAPKPADVVELIEGSGMDKAGIAWGKVDKAIRQAGGYHTVIFDDPLIHAVVAEMGGWPYLCQTLEKDLQFRAGEFRKRYQGLSDREARPEFKAKLIGKFEAENVKNGFKAPDPVMIGNEQECLRVMHEGSTKASISIKPLALVAQDIKQTEE